MTRVCLLGDEDVSLRYELLSRETSRNALATYDLREPYQNTVVVETVSLGAAVALLNDLQWYLIRFVDSAFVLEPSVSDREWLSRSLATAIRDDDVDPTETGRFLKVFGIDQPTDETPFEETPSDETSRDGTDGEAASTGQTAEQSQSEPTTERPPRLVEPMLVVRTGETIPDYDIRDVDETLVVRVTEEEFDA
jgi:hypothetical protein